MELMHRLLELLPDLVATGQLDASGGNLAVRTSRGICITPTQAAEQLRWHLTADDFVLFPGGGEASMARAERRPSRDSRVHRAVLAAFPDWNFSYHGHCWGLMGFALAGRALPVSMCHSGLFGRNRALDIPVVPVIPSVSPELAEKTAEVMKDHFAGAPHGAVLLAGHGVVVAGHGIESTLSLAAVLENLARAQLWRLALPPEPAG